MLRISFMTVTDAGLSMRLLFCSQSSRYAAVIGVLPVLFAFFYVLSEFLPERFVFRILHVM